MTVSLRGRYVARLELSAIELNATFHVCEERKTERNRMARNCTLTEGRVVRADVVARGELRGEGGFSDLRCAQHAHFVSRDVIVVGILLRFYAR